MQAESCIEEMALARQNGSDGRLKETVHSVPAVHCTWIRLLHITLATVWGYAFTVQLLISIKRSIYLVWIVIVYKKILFE